MTTLRIPDERVGTGRRRHWQRVVAVSTTMLGLLAARTQAQMLRCADTPYSDGRSGNALTSEAHLVQLFGDLSARSTNLFEPGYDGMVSWTEGRLTVPRLSRLVASPIALPDPVLVFRVTGLKRLDWEDRLDYGGGLEWRPLGRLGPVSSPLARWLFHLRLYALYLRANYLQNAAAFHERPRNDVRIGIELYRECNIHSRQQRSNRLWAEVWADASWRRSNFVVNGFDSWTFAVVPRVGFQLYAEHALALMPYLVGELSATARSEPWQNRVVLGAGLRIMPFRSYEGASGDLLRGTRFYIERVSLITHLGEARDDTSPRRDARIGLTYTINRW